MTPGSLRNMLGRNPFVPLLIRRRGGGLLRAALPGQVRLMPGDRWLWLVGHAEGVPDRLALDDVTDVALEDVPSDYDVAPAHPGSREMTIAKFDEFLRRRPFVPFTIHTADGGSFEVKSPEFASRTQQGRTIFVSTGGETTEWIDLLLVSRISSGVSNIGSSGDLPPTTPESQPQA